jgi:hypothetical protein
MSGLPLVAWLDGVGLLAPGLPDWPSARRVLRGEAAYVAAPTQLPAPLLLPPAERRRASRVIKLVLALGQAAAADSAADSALDLRTLSTVFSASGADGHNCHALCEQLAGDDRRISPTRFHNSVHNAAAGYWGIASGAMKPCQVLAAYDASFGAGLLEAFGQVVGEGQPTLLVAYDSEYPEPLHSKRPLPDCAGIALLLGAQRSAHSLARLVLAPTAAAAEPLAQPELEALRTAIPALRGLPLLARLADGKGGSVCVDYLPPLQLQVEVEPC